MESDADVRDVGQEEGGVFECGSDGHYGDVADDALAGGVVDTFVDGLCGASVVGAGEESKARCLGGVGIHGRDDLLGGGKLCMGGWWIGRNFGVGMGDDFLGCSY